MAFTSIKTAGGWQVNTVKPAYDLLFHLALNPSAICRQFVDIRPGRPTHQGDSVTLQIKRNFAESVVTAAKTPLDEETDVTATQLPQTDTVTFTPREFGLGTLRSLKIANRSMVPLDPEIARAVGDHCGKTVDELLQDRMVTGTQVYRPNARATTVTVTGTDVLDSDTVRLGVTKLRTNGAAERDGTFFVGLVHPNAAHDLRKEGGPGGWRTPREYVDPGQLYRGETGEWEGVRFIENARLRKANDGATSATVYRSFILGREALGEAVVTEPHIVIGPVVDTLERFRPVGWYGDLDFQIFRDAAMVRIESASSAS